MIHRALKTYSKRWLRLAFETSQRFGMDILPRHFYSEIPNIRELRANTQWRAPLTLSGVTGADADTQMRFVEHCTAPFKADLPGLNLLRRALEMNGSDEGYGAIEADFLYCFVRKIRPPKILQIGCGVSTAVCLLAARDEGYKPEIICVEPYPTPFLSSAAKAGDISLIKDKLQNVYGICHQHVAAGDLFFVDSSHTLGPSGEVTRIVLEILPRLQAGIFVHFHDIWFPYDYSPGVLDGDLFFWHETAILCAFLCMNRQFSVLSSLSMLHHQDQEKLKACLPTYRPRPFVDGVRSNSQGHYPSSIYLRS